MTPAARQLVLDESALQDRLRRMADSIRSRTQDASQLLLVGIQRRGVELAQRLARLLREQTGAEVPQGALDITLYRDDLEAVGPKPLVGPTHLPVDLDGRHVWVVDDVLYTGRTVRAALNELGDYGRPARIDLAVLVDRGGRELPIHADVVGERIETGPTDRVDVCVSELDGRDSVELVRQGAEEQ